ncbi:MFS transporter [Pueribacillus theae]|nr:MFS transporter [Pueribacillus theae]
MENTASKKRWMYVVIGAFTMMIAIAFARMSYGVILPYMRDGLSLTYKQSGFLGTVTSLGYLAFVLLAGVVAVKWGGKKTILFGVSCTIIGFIGLSITMNFPMTIFFMLLLGIGTAFTFTTLVSIVTGWFPDKRGLSIGLMTSGVGIGGLLTGLLVPFLSGLSSEGWRLSWGFFAFAGLITLLLIAIFIKDPPNMKMKQHDKKKNVSSQHAIKIFKNPNLIIIGIIYGIVGLTHLAQSIFIMSFMLQSGISPSLAGKLVAVNGIFSIFSSPFWGYISDRIGRMNSLLITVSLSFLSMSIALISQSFIGFSLHMILLSLTISGLFTLVQAASLEQVDEPKDMPIAFSYVTFYFASGQLLGPMIAGWMIEDFGGFKRAFLMLSAFLAVGIILAVLLKVRTATRATNPAKVKQTVS